MLSAYLATRRKTHGGTYHGADFDLPSVCQENSQDEEVAKRVGESKGHESTIVRHAYPMGFHLHFFEPMPQSKRGPRTRQRRGPGADGCRYGKSGRCRTQGLVNSEGYEHVLGETIEVIMPTPAMLYLCSMWLLSADI